MSLIPRDWLRHVQGSGKLEWVADDRLAGCLADNAPFPDDLARGEPRLLLLRLTGGGRLRLPAPGWALQLPGQGELAGFVDLVWPGEESDLLKQAGWAEPLPDGEIALALVLQGEATVRLKPKVPRLIPEGTAGGRAELLLIRRYPRGGSSRDMLRDLFGRLCLPARLTEEASVLDERSTLALQWNGTLRVAAEAFGSAALAGVLPLPALLSETPLPAMLQAGFWIRGRLHRNGRLGLLVTGGGSPGKVRATLSLGREISGRLAVDVTTSAALAPAGTLPALQDILGRLLGLDLPRLLGVLARLAEASEASSAADPLTALVLDEVLDPLLHQAEESALPAEVIRRVAAATQAVLALDDSLRSLILRHAGNLSQLKDRLSDLWGAVQWADISAQSLRFLAGEGVDVAELLARQVDLRAWRRQLERVLSLEIMPTLERILHRLVGAVRTREVLAQLERFRTPEELRAAVNAPARRVAEAILGRTLAEAPAEELQRLLRLAAAIHHAYESVSRKIDEGLQSVLGREWEAAASFEALWEDGDQTVLSGEFDLERAGGREAFRALAAGDAIPALAAAVDGVVVTAGEFTRRLQRRRLVELQLGPLHWTSLENLIVHRKLEVRPEGQGWAHLVTLDAKGEKRRTGPSIGSMQSLFTLRAAARALLPAINTAPDVGPVEFRATYRLNAEDPATQPGELAALLAPAVAMGLLPDAAGAAAEMLAGAGSSPAVHLVWNVRIPPDAFRSILEDDTAGVRVEEAILEILEWNYLRHGRPGSWLRVLGGALAEPENRVLFARRGHLAGAPCTARLGPAQGLARIRRVPLGTVDRQRLEAVYRIARAGGEVFARMAARIATATAGGEDLEHFVRQVAELHNRLGRWGLRLDTLPHVLYRVGRERSGAGPAWAAALELEIQPRRGEPIHRFIKSPAK